MLTWSVHGLPRGQSPFIAASSSDLQVKETTQVVRGLCNRSAEWLQERVGGRHTHSTDLNASGEEVLVGVGEPDDELGEGASPRELDLGLCDPCTLSATHCGMVKEGLAIINALTEHAGIPLPRGQSRSVVQPRRVVIQNNIGRDVDA